MRTDRGREEIKRSARSAKSIGPALRSCVLTCVRVSVCEHERVRVQTSGFVPPR